MLGKRLVISSEAEDKISCDPSVSLPDYTLKQQFLKTFDLTLYFYKLWRTSKNFCLYGLYLLIFTILEIKTEKLLKRPVNALK